MNKIVFLLVATLVVFELNAVANAENFLADFEKVASAVGSKMKEVAEGLVEKFEEKIGVKTSTKEVSPPFEKSAVSTKGRISPQYTNPQENPTFNDDVKLTKRKSTHSEKKSTSNDDDEEPTKNKYTHSEKKSTSNDDDEEPTEKKSTHYNKNPTSDEKKSKKKSSKKHSRKHKNSSE